MTRSVSNRTRLYGYLEHQFAAPLAETLATNSAFRAWLLQRTKFADRGESRILLDEMRALRTTRDAPWWKNYFTGSCDCFGCAGGRETDVFAVLEDVKGTRFALHIEIKQPSDRFSPKARQAERYRARAECWASSAPRTIPSHSEACTILVCSETKRGSFAAEIMGFDHCLTFEEIALSFPNATVPIG
jgi:hypothetical protein